MDSSLPVFFRLGVRIPIIGILTPAQAMLPLPRSLHRPLQGYRLFLRSCHRSTATNRQSRREEKRDVQVHRITIYSPLDNALDEPEAAVRTFSSLHWTTKPHERDRIPALPSTHLARPALLFAQSESCKLPGLRITDQSTITGRLPATVGAIKTPPRSGLSPWPA